MGPTLSLVPHAVCWAAAPKLIWTMVVTNLVTFLSYLTISLTLLYLVSRTRRIIARDWGYFTVGFALFIVACGSTHLMEVVTTWSPFFWTAAGTNIVTAALSAYVAVMLIRRAQTIAFAMNDYAGRLADTENEKLRMQESLLAAQRLEEWSRMSAVIAHEISNPLETIQNLLHLIQRSHNNPEEVARYAQIAAEETQRVETISRSTLSFFRQSARPEPIDLTAAAESVRFLLDPMARLRGIQLDVTATGDVTVEAFPGETRQVLLNLVRNAYEATGAVGALVRVKLIAHERTVEVVVADNGSGMDAQTRATLFQFGRSTKGEQGNGVGLWTVKQIVNKHGGQIAVESSPGEGATFKVLWPRHFSGSVSGSRSVASV